MRVKVLLIFNNKWSKKITKVGIKFLIFCTYSWNIILQIVSLYSKNQEFDAYFCYFFTSFIIENKKYFYSHQLIHNKTVDNLFVICSLTEHGIVLSQAEQFDVLDLYKTHTECKVASSNMSHAHAHAGFFRLLMKGPGFSILMYILRPFDKKLIS
jgi:hypothetical protein